MSGLEAQDVSRKINGWMATAGEQNPKQGFGWAVVWQLCEYVRHLEKQLGIVIDPEIGDAG